MSENRSSHNKYQKKIFAEEADDFYKPIPDQVEKRLQRIVASVLSEKFLLLTLIDGSLDSFDLV